MVHVWFYLSLHFVFPYLPSGWISGLVSCFNLLFSIFSPVCCVGRRTLVSHNPCNQMAAIGSWGVGSTMIRTHFMMLRIVRSSERALTALETADRIKNTWSTDGSQMTVISRGRPSKLGNTQWPQFIFILISFFRLLFIYIIFPHLWLLS